MALISNEGEPVTRWWVSKALETVKIEKNIFSGSNRRTARLIFIAGANRVDTIKGWMSASQLIDNSKNSREYELTTYGLSILDNDPKLVKSSTWWSLHISLCFSQNSEPYPFFFKTLENNTKDWVSWSIMLEKTKNNLHDENGNKYKDSTIDSLLSSVRRMLEKGNPLAELGLIETRKDRQGMSIRLGSPRLTDEILIHALAMCRFTHFKSRESIDFSVLAQTGLPHFLCCSKDQLRQHYQRMSQMQIWHDYFSFDQAVDLESITFKDACTPDKTVLLLLQQGQDTWM